MQNEAQSVISQTLKLISALFFFLSLFSPYKRTLETWDIMKQNLEDVTLIGTRQEPRIAEQQFGNFQVRIVFGILVSNTENRNKLIGHCINVVETL